MAPLRRPKGIFSHRVPLADTPDDPTESLTDGRDTGAPPPRGATSALALGKEETQTIPSGLRSGLELKEKYSVLESLSSEELQFIKAIEKYKAENNKTFLSWTEVLKILKGLGYRRSEKNRDKAATHSEGVSTK